MKSVWNDQRDISDSKWGKEITPGCECTSRFTCRACLDKTVNRNLAERFALVADDKEVK